MCRVISECEDIAEQLFSAILSVFRSVHMGLSKENKSHLVSFVLAQMTEIEMLMTNS